MADNDNYFDNLADEGKTIYKVQTTKDGQTKTSYKTEQSAVGDISRGETTSLNKAYNEAMSYKPSGVGTNDMVDVYSDGKGNYSGDANDVMSFNYENGKVNITASEDVRNTDWYKQYTSDSMKNLYKMYAADPTGKTTITYDDGSEATVEEAMKKVQEGFNENANAQRQRNKVRREVKKATGVNMSDSDTMIWASSASRGKDENSDEKVVYIPQVALLEFPDLADLASYNAETGTISAKDFYKWYDLDDGTENKDDRILRLFNRLENYTRYTHSDDSDAIIEEAKEQLDNGEISQEEYDEKVADAVLGSAEGATEYAKAYSLLSTMNNDTAKHNIATGIKVFQKQFNRSLAHNLAGVGYGVNVVLENVPIVNNIWKGAEALNTQIGGAVAGVDQKETDKLLEKIWATGAASEVMGQLDYLDEKSYKNLGTLSSAAGAGAIVGGVAAEALKQVLITNPVGEAVGSAILNASSAVAGATKVVKSGFNAGYKAAKSASSAAAAFQAGMKVVLSEVPATELVSTINNASKVISASSTLGKTLSTSTNLLAQGVMDTVISDPALLDKALDADDTGAVLEAVAQNTVYNAIGELTGLGTTKITQYAKDSYIGIGIQEATFRMAAKKYDFQAAFAEKLADKGIAAGKNAKVANSMKVSAESARQAANEISEAMNTKGLSKADLVSVKNKAIADRVKIESAIKAEIKGDVSGAYNDILSDVTVKETVDDAMKSTDALYKAEKAAGLKPNGKAIISQDTSNYIVAKQRVMRFTGAGKLSDGNKDILNQAKSIVSNFENKFGSNKALMDAVADTEQKFGKAFQAQIEFEINNHLLTPDQEAKIVALREGGRWGEAGENYIGSIAIKDGEDVVGAVNRWVSNNQIVSKDITNLGIGDTVKSAAENYVDPLNTLLALQARDAALYSAVNAKRLIADAGLGVTEIDIAGRPITKSEVKQSKKAFSEISDRMRKSFLSDDAKNFDLFKDWKAPTQKEALQKSMTEATKETEAKLATDTEKNIKRIDRSLNLRTEKDFANAAYSLDDATVNTLRTQGFDLPEYHKFNDQASFDAWFNTLDKSHQAIVSRYSVRSSTKKNATIKYDVYNNVLDNSPMVNNLIKLDVSSNKSIYNSEAYKNTIRQMKQMRATAKQATFLKENAEKYNALVESRTKALEEKLAKTNKKIQALPDFNETITDFTNKLKNQFTAQFTGVDGKVTDKVVEGIYKQLEEKGIPSEIVEDYYVMSAIKDFIGGDKPTKKFTNFIEDIIKKETVFSSTVEQRAIAKELAEGIQKNVQSDWAEAAQKAVYNGASDAIDMKEVSEYATKQMSDFVDEVADPKVLRVIGDDGQWHLYQMDSAMADFVNAQGYVGNNNLLSKFIRKTNQIFRFGTTTINLRSMVNQYMRDPINAWIVGGMNNTVNGSRKELSKYLGDMSVDEIAKSLDISYEELIAKFGEKATSKEIAEGLSRGLTSEAGEIYAGEAASVKYYADITSGKGTLGSDSMVGKSMEDIRKAGKSLDKQVVEKIEGAKWNPNNFRENSLRKAVYMSNINKSIKAGHTLQEARTIAQYIADNATTDFSRGFAWGNSIIRHVPYLGAAINGTNSFWRLLEIDPVGISTRFLGGMAFPMMQLTAMSLQGENREVYMNIPEYEKENSLVFVVGGQKYSFAIPQELAGFVKPWRQAVEKMNGANNNSFVELIANDILSISPIDIDSFVSLDQSSYTDNGFIERVSDGVSGLISQLSPEYFKTAYMAVTGIDPYTKKKIDKSYTYLDDDGNIQTHDYTSDSFAIWFSELTGGNMSPSSVYALSKSLFGQGVSNIASDVVDLCKGNMEGIATRKIEAATKPFGNSEVYDQKKSQFSQDIKTLTAEKEKMLEKGGKIDTLNQAISKATDEATKLELRTELRQVTQDYADKVKSMVEKYVADGGEYSVKQVKQVLSLLTFSSTSSPDVNDYVEKNSKQQYYDARNLAEEYLRELGFHGTTDYSELGYMTTDAEGKTTIKLIPPTQIRGIENSIKNQNNIVEAQIEAAIKNSDLGYGSDAQKEKTEKLNEAYNNKDYTTVNKIKKEWDAKVMNSIYPALSKYANAEEIIGSDKVVDYLNDIIEIPDDMIGKGKYYSSKTGLNKKEGYAKYILQKLYANMNKENK